MEAGTKGRLDLARHYVSIDQPDRALDQLADLGPDFDDPEAWRLRGWALTALERYDEAAGVATQGLERSPDSPELLELLAVVEGRRRRLAEAERAILAALALAPDDPDLLCVYAELLGHGGQFEKADRVVEEAARLAPQSEHVLRTRMALAYLRGDDRLAERLGEELLSLDPDSWVAHRMVGVSALQRGETGRASRHFDSAARHDMSDHEAATAAREVRAENHPLMWPLWPFRRLGPIGAWLGAIVTIGVLGAVGLNTLAVVFLLAYVALCVYSWVAPPLLRAWLRRRAP